MAVNFTLMAAEDVDTTFMLRLFVMKKMDFLSFLWLENINKRRKEGGGGERGENSKLRILPYWGANSKERLP